LIGVEGKTSKKILTEDGFDTGSTVEVEINAADVGSIYGVILSQTSSDPWAPQLITVKRAG